jgi:hypothetical protein
MTDTTERIKSRIPMLKVGNNIWIVAVVYLMRIRLTSPIRLRMNGRMNRLFNLTIPNDFD